MTMDEMQRIEISINTFGLSRLMAADDIGTFQKLKAYGADGIEPCVMFVEQGNPLLHSCR